LATKLNVGAASSAIGSGAAIGPGAAVGPCATVDSVWLPELSSVSPDVIYRIIDDRTVKTSKANAKAVVFI